ncbi:MAG: hypothetical protein B7X76_01975, partial [Azorhizobium sp. 39-67-5]
MGRLRRKVWDRDGWFVLIDLVGVKDFWSSVALGFLNSLQVKRADGMTQYDRLILKIAEQIGISDQVGAIAGSHKHGPDKLMAELAELFRQALARRYRQETLCHRDVVTALILLTSDDLDQQSIAHAWLQGMPLDPQDLKPLGFKGGNDPITVVKGLSWLMSLVGPTLIGVDQIDTIVSAANASARADANGQEAAEVASIVEQLRQGLMDLYEVKRRALVVVSCLEATWQVLIEGSTVAVTARFREKIALSGLSNGATVQALIAARLEPVYREAGFSPPYPTWPFRLEAFADATGLTPREILRKCERHQYHCMREGVVRELMHFGDESKPDDTPRTHALDALYVQANNAAVVDGLLEETREDDLRALFAEALQHFERQLDLPDDVSSLVQFETVQKRPSLHGRLSFTFHAEGDGEHHYCFRVLAHAHAIAFQSRMTAAITDSGIGTKLAGRHLFLLRGGELPTGQKTRELVDKFLSAGGRFISPANEDLRAFVALRSLSTHPDFPTWLRQRKPLLDVPLFKAAGLCPPPFPVAPTPPNPPATLLSAKGAVGTSKVVDGPPTTQPLGLAAISEPARVAIRPIIIGRKATSANTDEPVGLAPELLNRHVGIFAGVGSGKTVLLRRLVEEASLRGIPSIVLDINNDLSRLGMPWPAPPADFTPEDIADAARYHEKADMVIWTPGVSSGNPLSLGLLPDFSAIGNGSDPESEDERNQAVEMARATLEPYMVGGGQKAKLKQGVLASALRRFALGGKRELKDLLALLADLPEGVSDIGNAEKLAGEMADQLRAAVDTNPLLRSSGARLDPALLFHGPDPARTRISVINLAGLASDAAREAFVNQLQMALFTWVKQNPSPTGRLYVLDEAQNFAPSQASTACKASTKSLAAQARKYGLGMVFAT